MNEDLHDRIVFGLLAYLLSLVAVLATFLVVGVIYSGIMYFIN